MEFSRTVQRFGDEIFAALNEKKIALEKQHRILRRRSTLKER